jgi:hypothetical protein
VEQIMRQIRARIREKRGVDYTEDEIRELANVKLEKFLDPRGIRSDLLEQYRRKREAATAPRNYSFEDATIYASSRPLLRFIRRMLNPILKLFFNPNPMIDALHIQSKLNDNYNQAETLYYELIHNLVLETTRLGVEVKNLKMRIESMSSRLDFDERRARALEGVVQYRPGAVAPLQPPTSANGQSLDAEGLERRTRRRRRRGRRHGTRSQEPGTRSQEPGVRDQDPGARNQDPGARNQGPGARNQDPGARNQGPGARIQEPGAGNQEPGARVQDAEGGSQRFEAADRARDAGPEERIERRDSYTPPPQPSAERPDSSES